MELRGVSLQCAGPWREVDKSIQLGHAVGTCDGREAVLHTSRRRSFVSHSEVMRKMEAERDLLRSFCGMFLELISSSSFRISHVARCWILRDI